MSKIAFGLIITGIILLLPNIFFLVFGLPDEIDVGKAFLNAFSEVNSVPQAERILQNSISALNIASWASWLIPVTFIIIGFYILVKEEPVNSI